MGNLVIAGHRNIQWSRQRRPKFFGRRTCNVRHDAPI